MNLREEHWQKLKPLLLGGEADPGATGRDNRQFMQAIFWIVANRAKWSALPPEFGRWQNTYVRFMRWNQADVWRQLAQYLSDDSELQKMLNAVVAFGDEYTRRAARRLANKSNRIAYNLKLGGAARPNPSSTSAENTITTNTNAGADWVWLLTGK